MELLHSLENLKLIYTLTFIFLVSGVASIFLVFISNTISLHKNVKKFTFLFSVLAIIFISISFFLFIDTDCKLAENRYQIKTAFEEKGYEILNPEDEIQFGDHEIHEVYILKDNSDINKMAYRIGRCDCYFFIYEIVDGSYINIT